MSFYTKMALTARRALTRFGATLTLKRVSGETFDAVTGVTTAGVDASVQTTGLLRVYPAFLVDGSAIMAGDRELILSDEQEPLSSDLVVISGEQWSIIRIKTVKPDMYIPVIYFLQVRK